MNSMQWQFSACARIGATVLAMAGSLALVPALSQAQTIDNIANGGTLVVSTGSGGATSTTQENLLSVPVGQTYGYNLSSTVGMSFSGASFAVAGSNPPLSYYYTDYLISVAPGTLDSITSTLSVASGGAGSLSERIYAWNGTSFLGINPVPSGALQVWSTNIPQPGGASVQLTGPADVTAGLYVVEFRATTTGNFGGAFSVTASAVPEPSSFALLAAGLAFTGLLARSRRRA